MAASRKIQIIVALVVVIGGGGGAYLHWLSGQPSAVPKNPKHADVTAADCVKCHAPEMEAPLGKDHPKKNKCLVCHQGAE